jgi:hypothetical protein
VSYAKTIRYRLYSKYYRFTRPVKGINIRLPNFGHFQSIDLERLKSDRGWLSDAHVTLGLRYDLFFFVISLSELYHGRDCFQDCESRGIWGKTKIKLLDTLFWQKLSKDPEQYHERCRSKVNLLDCDYAVIPIFEM